MRNRIVMHLADTAPSEESLVSWVLLNPEGALISRGEGPLGRVREEAGGAAERAEVAAIVSGYGLMLTEVEIPSRQSAHLRKALPFMIEEQLAGDLRQTHLAIAPTRYGDSVPVAVVAHEQMIRWLDCLHRAGLVPGIMTPEPLLLPREPGSICVHVHGDRALVRLGDFRGLSVPLENLVLVLELALTQRSLPCNRIELSACVERPDDMEQADRIGEEVGARLDRPIWRSNYKESLVEVLAKGARDQQLLMNLCQGGYRADGSIGKEGRSWRIAWAAAAACFVLLAGASFGTAAFLDARALDARSESIALFKRMFPDERRILNLRRQAEMRLAAASGPRSGALGMMAKLGASLGNPGVTGASVSSLKYEADAGTLTAEIKAASLAQVDRLAQLLGEAGLGAKVLSASEESGVATARLELR